MMPAPNLFVSEHESLHRHIDAITAARHSLGPWPERTAFAKLGIVGVYASSADGASWVVATSTSVGPLAFVIWTMGLGAGRKPLLRRELIGQARGNVPQLTTFWRSDVDANFRLKSDDAAFAEAHELTEHARVTAAVELLRAVFAEGLIANGRRARARIVTDVATPF